MDTDSQLHDLEPHQAQKHWSTPHKQRLKSQVALLERAKLSAPDGRLYPKTRLFKLNDIPTTTAKRILKEPDPRRLHNSQIRKETRGRRSKITPQDIRYMELIIQRTGQEGRVLSWQSLGIEAGLDLSGETIRRAMGSLHYRRCLACRKSWVSPDLADRRVTWARDMLQKYPEPKDWYHVRFSDETHLGFGSQGRIWVIRKPGERSCPDCLQTDRIPKEKDQKRVHAWAAVGFRYKSRLYRYDNGTSNGKMDQKTYITLLEKECLKWPKDWVLEEDSDSGHGKSENNPVRKWKEAHNLKTYFNCVHSPDLAPIENAWQAPKAALRKFGHWDDDSIWELAQEGWENLSQETINKWVESIPQRLKDVIARKGQLTGY